VHDAVAEPPVEGASWPVQRTFETPPDTAPNVMVPVGLVVPTAGGVSAVGVTVEVKITGWSTLDELPGDDEATETV